jgi:uncharacterized membrane protein/protein-disulfide isomerase
MVSFMPLSTGNGLLEMSNHTITQSNTQLNSQQPYHWGLVYELSNSSICLILAEDIPSYTIRGLRSSMYRPISKWWLYVLSVCGAAISAIALYEHVIYRYGLAAGPSFCNISQHINCEAVNASEWSVFFGLPIASYGLFFYGAVLGLLWISGPTRRLSDARVNKVVFVGGVVGSLVSILLLCISEFLIGALCLLCLALYLVSFLLLALTWWGSGEGFRNTLIGGLQELVGFVAGILRGERATLAGGVSLLLWGMVAALSPVVAFNAAQIVTGRSGGNVHDNHAQRDPVVAWREAQAKQIPLSIGAGAFGDYAKGVQGAPIQIVEFADFECPGCRLLYGALQSVLKKYEGRYHFVFKNYPLDSTCNPGITHKFHQNACFAAYFIRCAGEQGRFWEALDYAFTDPVFERDGELDAAQVQSVRDTVVSEGASLLDLDSIALRECVFSERYLQRVRDEVKQGDELHLQSTPSVWVNGRKVERPTSEALERIFAAIIAEQEASTAASASSGAGQ